MNKKKSIGEVISKTELSLAELKAVKEIFPEANFHGDETLSDKSVNKNYTGFDFTKHYSNLYVMPYHLIKFTFDGQDYETKVHSIPRKNILARMSWRRHADNKRTISFSRLNINMKAHAFKEDMFNSCKAEIMSFVKEHEDCVLDTTHLDPRLKKLLTFL